MLELGGGASSTQPATSASCMLSMLNMESSRSNAFLLGNPPLAALHSMADLRATASQASHVYQGGAQPLKAAQASMGLSCAYSTASGTPHGINDILGRPVGQAAVGAAGAVGATGLGAIGLPRFGLGVGAGVYFNPANGALHKMGLADLPGRPHLYWPSVVQNPALWRDRLASASGESPPGLYTRGRQRPPTPRTPPHAAGALSRPAHPLS
ncbi:homeobox protein Nkx-6.2, putative [Ixodes scapularis]|uniref:Homeobox protein Nkx-6.2, putative n=1 Tax=Ixodes scapularis TaxID=6945 RepID=B7QLW7_IXOSC|nr:homeobox protein Nkx-6.2, putative [Ixodes scapularis]|eukprot:XP_002416172.1 homeobox protein Nkx-6.2, putative [Ixodes scapularis]